MCNFHVNAYTAKGRYNFYIKEVKWFVSVVLVLRVAYIRHVYNSNNFKLNYYLYFFLSLNKIVIAITIEYTFNISKFNIFTLKTF